MTYQLSLLPMLDDAEHPTWLLNGKPGIQNENGVYVDNVFRFREGKLSGVNVEVNLCAEGDFVLFEFDYFTGTYGCGHIWSSRAIHQKYKRCLAMARIAQDDWHLHNSFYALGHQEFEKRKCAFYEKWHKRWLKIAEKFKTN